MSWGCHTFGMPFLGVHVSIRWFVFFVLKGLHYTLFCEVLLLLICSSYFFFYFWTKAGVVPLSSYLFPLILLKENTVLKLLSSELRAILNGFLSCFQLLVKPISKTPIWPCSRLAMNQTSAQSGLWSWQDLVGHSRFLTFLIQVGKASLAGCLPGFPFICQGLFPAHYSFCLSLAFPDLYT